MRKYKITIEILIIVICMFFAWLVAVYSANAVSQTQPTSDISATELSIDDNAKSYGQQLKDIYSIEIWEDGIARILTLQGYVQEIGENTVIITDKSLNEVQSMIESQQ